MRSVNTRRGRLQRGGGLHSGFRTPTLQPDRLHRSHAARIDLVHHGRKWRARREPHHERCTCMRVCRLAYEEDNIATRHAPFEQGRAMRKDVVPAPCAHIGPCALHAANDGEPRVCEQLGAKRQVVCPWGGRRSPEDSRWACILDVMQARDTWVATQATQELRASPSDLHQRQHRAQRRLPSRLG